MGPLVAKTLVVYACNAELQCNVTMLQSYNVMLHNVAVLHRMLEYSFSRLFVPWNIRSHDGTFVLGTIRSLELSFPGRMNTADLFPHRTIRSLDRSFPRTFREGNARRKR